MKIRGKQIGLKEVGMGMIFVGLALLLPTPLLLIVGGSWLGWKGMKRAKHPKPDDISEPPLGS